MSDIVNQYTIAVDQLADYEFRVKFDKEHYPTLDMDEPPPLGKDRGPSAGRLLAATIGNCLSASFLFAAKKSGLAIQNMHTEVKVEIVRNENRRHRVGRIEVLLDPRLSETDIEKAKAAAAVFEDFCTITASVRKGIQVDVSVKGV